MLSFLRRRSAKANAAAALLFTHVEMQLREIGQLDDNSVSPAAQSFWLHDYMTGLVTAAKREGHMGRAEGRRAFTEFMVKVMGVPPSAAQSCYATSRGHCRSNPREEAFLDGIADAEALLSGRRPQQPIIMRFRPQQNVEAAADRPFRSP
jgi:hypothetical protein